MQIVLRIRCDAEVAQCQLGMKFGCDPVTEGPSLLHLARMLGLNVVGVSFHVGSGCKDPPVYHRAIRHCKTLFDIATDLGFKPYLLDLGGGYPGNKGTSIDKFAEVINKALDEYFNSELHRTFGCELVVIDTIIRNYRCLSIKIFFSRCCPRDRRAWPFLRRVCIHTGNEHPQQTFCARRRKFL